MIEKQKEITGILLIMEIEHFILHTALYEKLSHNSILVNELHCTS
jgi:hypothetical protein